MCGKFSEEAVYMQFIWFYVNSGGYNLQIDIRKNKINLNV